MPLTEKKGVKLISPTEDFPLESLRKNIEYIKKTKSLLFPKIYDISEIDGCLAVEMELVKEVKKAKLSPSDKEWLKKDFSFVEKTLENNLKDLTFAISEFSKLNLCPEDEWYKSLNMTNGKIVDFHWFYEKNNRYKLASSETKEASEKRYKKAVEAFQKRSDNKWKGKIYQGFRFDNGCVMEGYSSDGKEFDSYLKLPFAYMGKMKGKEVYDFGCNEGFFSTQAYIHGAEKVIGVDLTKEDIQLANTVKDIIGAGDALNFVNGDAIKEFSSIKEVSVVVMNSVLHQIYRNMVGSDELLRSISKKAKYFVFETPADHPAMSIPLQKIQENLKKHFKNARLMYVYDAYSSGYRANFICHNL